MPAGRFAPSPTGPLHMGSLVTALASFLHIKQRAGQWYLRIDDIDPPRVDPNATRDIFAALDAHGLKPDEVQYQSRHHARYENARQELEDRLYFCTCTRKQLSAYPVYPGFCRDKQHVDGALRVKLDHDVRFHDQICGISTFRVGMDFADPIIRRRDGYWSYHFATAIDDSMDFSDVTRGQDLLQSAASQIAILELLGRPIPAYAHVPLVCFADGTKLSKQSKAPPIGSDTPVANMTQAYNLMQLMPPRAGSVDELLGWGMEQFHLHQLPASLAPYV